MEYVRNRLGDRTPLIPVSCWQVLPEGKELRGGFVLRLRGVGRPMENLRVVGIVWRGSDEWEEHYAKRMSIERIFRSGFAPKV